ncbi:hypothetical protein [Loktanella sp. M215]|uniref:hypothetical protein n=1 Tax=Loktanella sp. M215 TaxID=2675431 RepID=UPI001F2DAAAD|nr:hypothetical protein [Loktanella sp. M215]MCF7701483.1 hypothetical protein [Loktanella sp. M215]MCF7702514.1 hypothetical protein [Loktanella sp. M215]
MADLIKSLSSEAGIDPSAFMQRALERAVYEHLPADRRREIDNTTALYEMAQTVAREIRDAGKADEHFTLTVFRAMMAIPNIRALYEEVIGVDAYADKAPGKMPLNMYLGWYIKKAVGAEPLLDDAGTPRREYVTGEPIKSYTLLAVEPPVAAVIVRAS